MKPRNGTAGAPRACLIIAPPAAPRCRRCERLHRELAAERHATLDLRLRLDALRTTQGEIVALLSVALDALDELQPFGFAARRLRVWLKRPEPQAHEGH
jgi:hypothetical protein